jgi:hypothetical protein
LYEYNIHKGICLDTTVCTLLFVSNYAF